MSNMLAQFHERWSAVESFFVRVMKPLNDKRKLEPFHRTARTWGKKTARSRSRWIARNVRFSSGRPEELVGTRDVSAAAGTVMLGKKDVSGVTR